MGLIHHIDRILSKIEAVVITLLLSVMILISFGQVILRNIFDQGILWGDPLLRQLVLWVGFLGASLAVQAGKHISIDFLPHFLPRSFGKPIRSLVQLSTAIISGFLAWAAWRFVQFEIEGGSTLFLDIPAWVFQTILPYSFGIISLRFLIRAFGIVTNNNEFSQ